MGEQVGTIRVSAARPAVETVSALPFLFTLTVYQYSLMTGAFADVRLGSASLQVAFVTLMLIACAIIQRERVIAMLGWQVFLVLALGLVFIPFKMLAGLLHPEGMQGMRLFFILPLVWGLYAAYVTDDATRNKVATIIIWNCVFIALFGLVHFFFFPSVVLTAAQNDANWAGNISLIPGHSQEAAFFGNPSAYGAILVTGLFAIYLTRRRTLVYAVAFLVITLATYISISRSAALFATLLVALYFGSGVSFRRPQSLLRVLAIVIAGVYVVSRFPFFWLAAQAAASRWGILGGGGDASISSFGDRLGSGRLDGYKVGIQIVFKDFEHIFLGAADTEEPVIGDVNFSDNSFIFLALGFGVPLTVLWIATVLRRTVPLRFPIGLRGALVLAFIYVTLITTPGLFWDMWLLYAVGLLFISDDFAFAPAPASESIRAVVASPATE
jgi:hypothetical protein